MNVQFGTGLTVTQVNTAQDGDARQGVAVPSSAENKDTTSFASVEKPQQNEKSKQDDARQGVEPRQALNEQVQRNAQERDGRRAEQKAEQEVSRKDSREDREQQQVQDRKENASDQSRLEERAEQRRQQDAAEQRQLEAELKQIQKLAERDREVRAHEQAHQAVGGQYAGAATYTFERGPDGKNYAVGGEVSIDIGKVADNPQATLQKAETVRRAALAPAEPSSQDRRVAAQATQLALEAKADIQQLQREELTDESQVEEDEVNKDVGEEERLDAEQEAQREQQQTQADIENVSEELQELNERMSRIQSQLAEISQFDDKVNSKVNLLDVAT